MKTIISVSLLAIAVFISLKEHKPQPTLTDVPNAVYDYIVVGAGSAGSVVASRLSENANVTVLLLEAGGDDRGEDRVTIPNFYGTLLDNAWQLYANTGGKSSNPKRVRLSLRGAMIMGGGSSVNVQVYARGSRHDFDQWSKLTKDRTWNYEHVLAYFRKSEGAVAEELRTSPYHGQQGPLSVSCHRNGWGIYETLIQAGKQLGFFQNNDYNGEFMEGISYTQYNTANGERVSCSSAFIHPALERPNLHVTTHAYVQRVLIRNKRVYGIEMIKNSRKFVILASKEAILSAGSIQSPKILMLSGIGPKEVLTSHGIPVHVDLPVGQNLQNHPMVEVPVSVTSPITGVWDPFFPWLSYVWYKLFKTGRLSTADADAVLFTSTTTELKEKDWPDLQLLFLGRPVSSTFMKGFKFENDIVEELAKQRDSHRYGFGCFPAVLRPDSRGSLIIASNDPYDPPIVHTNQFESKHDIDLLIRGVRICQSFVNTTAMRSVGASLVDSIPLSLCADHKFDSDDYWACTIQMKPLSHLHVAGTCKMGSDDDPMAVVDSKLRVKGIKGLRVVDASVMPVIVSANTNAAIVMIAEKAADMIQGKVQADDMTCSKCP